MRLFYLLLLPSLLLLASAQYTPDWGAMYLIISHSPTHF